MLNDIEYGHGAVDQPHGPGAWAADVRLAIPPMWEARNVNGHLPRAGKMVSRLGTLVVTGQGVQFRFGIGHREVVDIAGHTIVSIAVRRKVLGTWLVLRTADGQSFRFRLKLAAAYHALTLLRTRHI